MARATTQFIVDEKGRKKAVVLPLKEYERILERIAELEDALELDEAVQHAEGFADYTTFREELRQEGKL